MFNDVVVTLVQLIESSESSASVSIFIVILEAPAHQCPSETSCSFCLLGKVACNIQNFAQVIYYGKISHLENLNRERLMRSTCLTSRWPNIEQKNNWDHSVMLSFKYHILSCFCVRGEMSATYLVLLATEEGKSIRELNQQEIEMSWDFGETTVNHYHGLGLILPPLGVNSDARISTPPNFPIF